MVEPHIYLHTAWSFKQHVRHKNSGPDAVRKFYGVNLRCNGFERSDWLQILKQPIRTV